MSRGLVARMALRNLSRNVRRSVITGITVTFGVAVTVIGWGLVDGVDENALRAARTTATADVLLRPEGYPRDGMEWPLGMATVPSPGLTGALDQAGPWTSRVVASVRIVEGSAATRGLVIGWDPAREASVFPRDRWTIDGAWPTAPAGADGGGVVVGSGFARMADLTVGDRVVVEGRTRDGAINAMPFTVTGVVTTDNAAVDNTSSWLRMEDADALLALQGARTHLALRAPGRDAASIARSLTQDGWEGVTTREEVADMLKLNDIRRKAIVLLVGMVMGIAATGIANTVIMSVFERVREIGTLLAMGMRRAQVRAMFLFEGALLGVVSGAAGAVLGAAVVVYFEASGIVLSRELAQAGGNVPMSAVIYTSFSWAPLLGSFGFGVLVAILASLWPARHAASLHPADATRAD